MRTISLAVPIIAHGTKFGFASSLQGRNPRLVKLTSDSDSRQPHVDRKEKTVLLSTEVARLAAQGGIAAHNERTTEAFMPVLPPEFNGLKTNADGHLNAEGRSMQSSDWTQLGLDINGVAASDQCGFSVSLSSDGSVLAVGEPYNDPSGFVDAGRVRVYNFTGTGWTQLGLGIDGEAAGDQLGYSVSLSSDGSVLAVGAPYNDPSGSIDSGHVRVYKFNGSGWTQLGLNIGGEAKGDQSGWSVSLSSNGSVLAVGARLNRPSSGTYAGHVRVYNFTGTGWTQLGFDIDGEAAVDHSGWSISLSSDGSVLAVGAPFNDPNGLTDAGHVRVYKFNGSVWTQLGLDIDGKAAGDQLGYSVSLSSDGSVLAVGAPYNDPNGNIDAGHVRVYKFNGSGWTQLGLDIVGEANYDSSGWSVSLSSDGSVLAVGAELNDSRGHINAGHVRVYKFNGFVWTQLGLDIDGDATSDRFGSSVSLSSDGSVLAVGARVSDPGGRGDAGHVRVYKNAFLSTNRPSSTPSKSPSVPPTLRPSKAPSQSPSWRPSLSPSLRLKNLSEKSITSTCSVKSDPSLLECTANTDVLVTGIFKTSLVQGTCMSSHPPSQESPVSSIALDVNMACKNSGACNQTHCFRADFVVEGVSVLAAMSEVVSIITFEKDGSFSVVVNTSDFTATSEKTNTTFDATVIATLGECGSSSKIEDALQIGDTAVVCISSPDSVKLSLKSVTANPGNQVLINDSGDPNFLTTFNDNAKSVTLQTLIIPVYFDAQGGNFGSVVIEGTAEISYSARNLVSRRYLGEVEEALFGIEVHLVRHVEDPEVAQNNSEERNVGSIVGCSYIIPLAIAGTLFLMF